MTASFRIERSGAASVRVAGVLGFAAADAALARGVELYASGAKEVAVDVSDLREVDSATLAILLAWAARARQCGVTLRFASTPPGLRALARLCNAEPLLGIA